MMKKQLSILFVCLLLFACNNDNRTKEQKASDEVEAEVNQAAIPYIASDFAELTGWVTMVRQEFLGKREKQRYIDKIREKYPRYLINASIDNINSPEFEKNLQMTKDLITAKRRAQVLGVGE